MAGRWTRQPQDSCFTARAALAAAEFKIVTASERGTYIQIGRNLAEFIAPQADIALEALPSAGSAENVQRLRYEPGVKLALVQSDVYQAFLDQAASGNADARDMIRPLRVIMPLYNEEIYFIVREDSPLNYVHEIKEREDQRGRARQRHRAHHDDALPADVQRAHPRRRTRASCPTRTRW